MKSGHRKALVTLGAVMALAVAVYGPSAAATTVTAGNLVINVDGGVSPKALPKRKPAPITLRVRGSIRTSDGAHVPALHTLALKFDKHGTIFTRGLPTCPVGRITNTLTVQAKRACRKALVGTGKVTAEVQFPDSQPVPAQGTLLIFNGRPKGRKPVLIQHAYVSYPVAATVITKAVITNLRGRYGKATRSASRRWPAATAR